jgi:methylated-DNA-[protein]-cysteine S-methyltransferase
MPDFYQSEFSSPLGVIYLVTDGALLRALDFAGNEQRLTRSLARHCGRYKLHAASKRTEAAARLTDYFAGDLHAIDQLEVASCGTSFQGEVWSALREIPAGETISYATLAARIGRPTACRAVGLANGSNPISIVVPCHRVIGANTTLTGYGGGLPRKQWLLNHESQANRNQFVA